MGNHEEKIFNISRLIKLLQSYADAQEEDSANVRNQIKTIHQRIDDVVAMSESVSPGGHHTHSLGAKKRGLSPTKHNYNSIESQNATINNRKFLQLEDKVQ